MMAELTRKARAGEYSANFVPMVGDYRADRRVSLGLFAMPPAGWIAEVEQSLQLPLLAADMGQYATPARAMHFTIKNVKSIADPPNFSPDDAVRVAAMLREEIAGVRAFDIECEGFLETPTSVGLAGTYPEEIGALVQRIDGRLRAMGLADDKRYASEQITFTNLTLVRFCTEPNAEFRARVDELSGVRRVMRATDLRLVAADLAFSPQIRKDYETFALSPA